MRMSDIPFGTTDWAAITPTEHAGESGNAYWRTREFGGIRVRMVEYTPGVVGGAKPLINGEQRAPGTTRCSAGVKGLRRVKPLRSSSAALRPSR